MKVKYKRLPPQMISMTSAFVYQTELNQLGMVFVTFAASLVGPVELDIKKTLSLTYHIRPEDFVLEYGGEWTRPMATGAIPHPFEVRDLTAKEHEFLDSSIRDKNHQCESQAKPKCECGSEAVGSGGHSAWCPKFLSVS